MDGFFPLLILTAPERRRAEIMERLLPAAVGSVGERLAFTAVLAQQQISSREQAELGMVKEAAARFADADDLKANAPTLYGIYARLPDADRATVKFDTDSPGQRAERKPKPKEVLEAALKEQTMKEQTVGRKA